jgi:hypothetical protein
MLWYNPGVTADTQLVFGDRGVFMHRFALFLGVLFLCAATLTAAEKDTPAAANTRGKKLATKVSVDFQDQFLKECFAEISRQLQDAGSGSVSVRYDIGVSMNQRVTFAAKDETLEKVLDGMLKKNGLGYIVVSKAGDRYDGWLLVKQGNERGYAVSDDPKSRSSGKETVKAAPKSTAPPATDDEKSEKAAAGKLELARSLLKDSKTDRAKQRFQEIVQQYPKTKAADEARKELDKLK